MASPTVAAPTASWWFATEAAASHGNEIAPGPGQFPGPFYSALERHFPIHVEPAAVPALEAARFAHAEGTAVVLAPGGEADPAPAAVLVPFLAGLMHRQLQPLGLGRGVGVQVRRAGFRRPGCHQVIAQAQGVGAVAGAHQGFRRPCRLAAVIDAATAGVGLAGAAGTGANGSGLGHGEQAGKGGVGGMKKRQGKCCRVRRKVDGANCKRQKQHCRPWAAALAAAQSLTSCRRRRRTSGSATGWERRCRRGLAAPG